jgi:hypothetical protein
MRLLWTFVATLTVAGAGLAEPVARVDGQPIKREDLIRPLFEAHGLEMLVSLAQLELARGEARAVGVTVTPGDVLDERRLTAEYLATQVEGGGADQDPEELLTLYLQQQEISPAAFDIVLRINAHLRAIVRPKIAEQITDDALRQAFNIQFGEKARVRHIALPNLEQIRTAQQRLAGGDDFAVVARDMSTFEQTARGGGLMPEFSRQTMSLPDTFKQVAFALSPGQVSDPVLVDGSYHLVKLEKLIAPVAVRFEDVKANVRRQIETGMALALMNRERERLEQKAIETLDIVDPVLRQQLEAARAASEPTPVTAEELGEQLEQQREAGDE